MVDHGELKRLHDAGDRAGLLARWPDSVAHLLVARGDPRAMLREIEDPHSENLVGAPAIRALIESNRELGQRLERLSELPLDTDARTYDREIALRLAMQNSDEQAWREGLEKWRQPIARRAIVQVAGLRRFRIDDVYPASRNACAEFPSCFTLRQMRSSAAVRVVHRLLDDSPDEVRAFAREELAFANESLPIDPLDNRTIRASSIFAAAAGKVGTALART